MTRWRTIVETDPRKAPNPRKSDTYNVFSLSTLFSFLSIASSASCFPFVVESLGHFRSYLNKQESERERESYL